MTALELLQWLGQVIWVVLGAAMVVRFGRRRSRTNGDIALFFAAIALVTIEGRVSSALGLPPGSPALVASAIVAMLLPYLLLRLVNDFAGVPRAFSRLAAIGAVGAASLIIGIGTTSLAVILYLVAYFVAVTIYAAARVVMLTRASHGVTRRRMESVAWGSYLLGMTILVAGVGIVAPALQGLVQALTQITVLGSAIAYAVGFAPPSSLKRYWQIPELSGFLSRASVLPRMTMAEIVDDLIGVAARTFGGHAALGVWDEKKGVLRFRDQQGALPAEVGPSGFLGWRVFESQRPMYFADAATANPSNAAAYRKARVGPILIAPITAGDRRIGVLEVFAAREPLFAEDDLAVVELIARQAAVLLESRLLIDDAARVRAQEEAARLKEDFVSAAAHDLKTPLTTIMAQAQLLERRAEKEGRHDELTGLRRLSKEATQLAHQVEELLDASRLERGAFPVQLEPADLAEVARRVGARERPGARRVKVVVDDPVSGRFDPDRMGQLVDNLVENALKYSPPDAPVEVRVWREGTGGRVAVTDHGIGIPSEDLPYVFERFRRGTNVDHRRFSGIGLGLYICRGIAEQHGGRIWVESEPGRETTFNVEIPLAAEQEARSAQRPVGHGVAAS